MIPSLENMGKLCFSLRIQEKKQVENGEIEFLPETLIHGILLEVDTLTSSTKQERIICSMSTIKIFVGKPVHIHLF